VKLIVDGVVVSLANEVQVLAFGIEGGGAVAQGWVGDLRGLAAFELRQLDSHGLRGIGEAICQPPAIEGPGHALDASERASIQPPQIRRISAHIQHKQLITMIGDCHAVARGRDFEIDDTAQIQLFERPRRGRAVRCQDGQDFAVTRAI
jgi:hypothetical protein